MTYLQLFKKLKSNTQNNYHSENYLLLASFSLDNTFIDDAVQFIKMHNAQDYLNESNINYRTQQINKVIKELCSVLGSKFGNTVYKYL